MTPETTSKAARSIEPTPAAGRPGPLRAALVWTFRRVVAVYFRAIESAGDAPSADTAGRIFVANHYNALVDPILVVTAAPCPISPIAKSTLWKIPGLRWLLDAGGAVPIFRRKDAPGQPSTANEAVFDKIAAALAGGGNILIFPEGVSHSEPHLQEPKTGAARMLARARALGARGLSFQAVGLEFDEPGVFRSRCLRLWGPVRAVDAYPAEDAAFVAAVTEQIGADLSELLVEGPSWPERLLVARVAEMMANDAGDKSLVGWNAIGRQVEAAREALRGADGSALRGVEQAVVRYYDLIGEAGIDDARIAAGGSPPGRLGRVLKRAVILPLAIVGIGLYAVPYRLPGLIAEKASKEPDMLSTYKIGAGLLIHPLWAALLIGAAFAVLPAVFASVAAVIVVVSPLAALAWLDITPRMRQSLRIATGAVELAEIRRARAAATARIAEARARLGV